MLKETLDEIFAHAEAEYPKECCGIVVLLPDKRLKVLKCTNDHPEPTKAFIFDSSRLYEAEKEGQLLYVYHSHPDDRAELSTADLVQCEELDVPFLVVSWPRREHVTYTPKGHNFELVGRPFVYGIYDCLTLGRDYYKQKHPTITFPEIPVTVEGWWDDPKNETFYKDNLIAAGFVEVRDLKIDDVILMQFRSKVPGHLAIYLGDGYMMHHVIGRKSELAVYGGAWEVITRTILRHKTLL